MVRDHHRLDRHIVDMGQIALREEKVVNPRVSI